MIVGPTRAPRLLSNSILDGTDNAMTAHAMWHVPELVRKVFLYLDKWDLAPVSRVCAIFHVHATQLLWQTYDSARQLRGVTASESEARRLRDFQHHWDFLVSDGVYLNPKTFNWGRFTTYAPYVLSANMEDRLLSITDGYIPTPYLFPQLRSLTLSCPKYVIGSFTTPRLDTVLPPTLEHLELDIGRNDVFADTLLSLCHTMSSRPQPLKGFSIQAAVNGHKIYGAIAHCIRRLPLCKLTLDIGAPSTGVDEVLRACNEAEGLMELSILCPLDDKIPLSPGFSSLQKLSLDGHPTPCLSTLSSVQSSSLRELELTYPYYESDDDDDDDEAFAAEPISNPLQGIDRFKRLTASCPQYPLSSPNILG